MNDVQPWSKSATALVSAAQLDADLVNRLLDRADTLLAGGTPPPKRFSLAMLLFESSLRTRLGFAEAARRLGGVSHAIDAVRMAAGASDPESLEDTLRVTSGMCDVLAVRCDVDLAGAARAAVRPVISAGDALEHPSQALIDLAAMRAMAGPIGTLTVGVMGDLGMRSVRSLLKLFTVLPPRSLRLIAPPTREADARALAPSASFADSGDVHELDVLYLAGLPARRGEDSLGATVRAAFAFGPEAQARLPRHAVVLSPMPVIDEIAPSQRSDARIRMYEQSDRSVALRMALLEHALSLGGGPR